MFRHVKKYTLLSHRRHRDERHRRSFCQSGIFGSGSDLRKSKNTDRLEKVGAKSSKDNAAENVGDAQVVVYSRQSKKDNPEVIYGKEKNSVHTRPRCSPTDDFETVFGRRCRNATGTSTTSMIATILGHSRTSNRDGVVGGVGDHLGLKTRNSARAMVFTEADESDRSF